MKAITLANEAYAPVAEQTIPLFEKSTGLPTEVRRNFTDPFEAKLELLSELKAPTLFWDADCVFVKRWRDFPESLAMIRHASWAAVEPVWNTGIVFSGPEQNAVFARALVLYRGAREVLAKYRELGEARMAARMALLEARQANQPVSALAVKYRRATQAVRSFDCGNARKLLSTQDQGSVTQAAEELGCKVHELPDQYNWQVTAGHPASSSAVVLHPLGGGDKAGAVRTLIREFA